MRLKAKWFVMLVFLVSFGLISVSCSNSTTKDEETILGNEWSLLSLNGQAPITNSYTTLILESDGFHGSGGCNSYGGEYELDGQSIRFGQTRMTEMACPEPKGILQQEAEYMQALGSVTNYRLESNKLVLLKDNEILLEYKEIPPKPDVSLEEQKWLLITFAKGGMAFPPMSGEIFYVIFNSGTITVWDGCHELTGQYTTDNSSLQIQDLKEVTEGCPDDSINENRQLFLKLLKETESYNIKEDRLLLETKDENSLDFESVEIVTVEFFVEASESDTKVKTLLNPVDNSSVTFQQQPVLNQNSIIKASVMEEMDAPAIQIQFSESGKSILSEMTGNNIGKLMAIVVNGEVMSMPTIQEKIDAGTSVITGNFTKEEAKAIADSLCP